MIEKLSIPKKMNVPISESDWKKSLISTFLNPISMKADYAPLNLKMFRWACW